MCKEINISIDADNFDDAMNIAHDKVIEDYKQEKIVLTSDDYNGITLTQVECDGFDTEWKEL